MQSGYFIDWRSCSSLFLLKTCRWVFSIIHPINSNKWTQVELLSWSSCPCQLYLVLSVLWHFLLKPVCKYIWAELYFQCWIINREWLLWSSWREKKCKDMTGTISVRLNHLHDILRTLIIALVWWKSNFLCSYKYAYWLFLTEHTSL